MKKEKETKVEETQNGAPEIKNEAQDAKITTSEVETPQTEETEKAE